MSRWLALMPLGALVALGLLLSLYALGRDPHVAPQALVGKPMPDLTLASLDDGPAVRLHGALDNGPVLVNFFASWCGPCEIEHPALMQLQADQVRIVGVAYKDVPPRGSAREARAFLARLGDPFAARLVDSDGRAGIEFGVTGVPETFVVDQDGEIIAKHTGALSISKARELAALVR